MASASGKQRRPTPVLWAFVVRESPSQSPPVAEAVVEIGAAQYGQLLEDAMASGFVLAAGEPPPTTAEVHVRAGLLTELSLVGGHRVWEPAPPAPVSPEWLSAARTRTKVVVIVVPPGTWPPVLPGTASADLADAFTANLQEARANGLVQHGTARLVTR
ncbi:hypothetical protein ACFC1R_33320 [Kitasatospora sp. NPDC056138]|uniref:hypothetical protein n=1 Tax=Kitasatospora sp. NPDC056138 TaxID=3345724 RepID=UPI0035DB1271